MTASFCDALLGGHFMIGPFLAVSYVLFCGRVTRTCLPKMAAASQADPAEPRGHALPGHRRD